MNPTQKVVAGRVIDHIYYRFYNGKLWRIDLYFAGSEYHEVKDAFVEKYGKPEAVQEQYSNASGATWDGDTWLWSRKEQSVVISDGGTLGPGQNMTNSDPMYGPAAMAIFQQTNIAPPKGKAKVDF